MKESELKSRLTRFRQIKLSVIGRKFGQTISNFDSSCFSRGLRAGRDESLDPKLLNSCIKL
jgi:hypothetical protein